MKIWLARHGETDWNVRFLMQGTTDTELNENGLAQAAKLGEAMKDSGVTHVYTSYLRRAARTGQIVAQCLGVPCEVREGLQETGLGEWEGRLWKDICIEDPEGMERWIKDRRHARPPKGENYQEVLDRFIGAVMRITRENTQDVMIVTHNGTIKAFLAELNSTPLETMGEDYPTPNAGAIAVDAERILKRFG
jgi:broad specificity phosphatase PhoE